MTMNRTFASLAIASFALVGIASPAIASSSPLEDQVGWSCVDDGNRTCGPDNSNGAPVGHYDIGGVLIGDDNHDGRIVEDESGWDCALNGNRICGSFVR